MSFDTLILKKITDELQAELPGAPVQKVYEPEWGEVVIHLYSRGSQPGLLFSIDSAYSRVHLTEKRHQRNNLPSPFCMLLRKYLVGARAVSFSNPYLERILEIDFDPPEGLQPVKLIAEIMSRRSNLILVNDSGVILGAAKTASWDKNPMRVILPGERYQPPPAQDKLDPLALEAEQFAGILQDLIESGMKPEKALFSAVSGISPLTARELLYRSGWNDAEFSSSTERLAEEMQNLFGAAMESNLQPTLLPEKNIYAAMQLEHLPEEKQVEWESANKMLEHYYGSLIQNNREKVTKEQLLSRVEKRLASLINKKTQQEKELEAAAEAPRHRLYGEILLAYGDQVPKGAESAVLTDIYNPDQVVTVPLNPSKSASANAQLHFNRYRRAKSGQQKIKRQLYKTRAEIEYCQGLLYAIENNSAGSLQEIRQEMIEAGFLKEKKKGVKNKDSAPQPLNFKTSAGRTVLVGRNNRQNDYITFKAAVRRDTWFHVKNLPGGHVVLKEAPYPPPPEDLEEAAFLAAYNSKGRQSGAVDVDYTEVRHVRRRPGGKPGFVFYENYETITVNAQDERLKKFFGLI